MTLDRTWFDALVDDDGSNTVGTVWNKAQIDALLDSIDYIQQSCCRVYTAIGTAIPSSAWTDVPFSGEGYDLLGMHAPNDRYVSMVANATYGISAVCLWPQSAAGSRGLRLMVNDVLPLMPGFTFEKAFDGGAAIGCSTRMVTTHRTGVAAERLGVQLWQDSGAAVVVPAEGIVCSVWRIS